MLGNSRTVYIDLDNEFQAFVITIIVLCFLGYLLVQMRATIVGTNKRIELQPSTTPVPGYVNAIFAGVLLETMFLVSYIYIRYVVRTHHTQLKYM